jgi:hypothetical protein
LRPPGQGPLKTETFATYITSLSEEDTAAEKYCKYINCRLGQLSVPALLDSGNVWRNVMSKQLLKKLGLGPDDLQPLTISKIQTAKMGASLEIMVELKQKIYLQLGGCQTRFRCRPIVVGGLTHDMNLSGPFLRQNKIDQIHSRDAIRINGHEVPLLTARGRPAVPRAEVSSAPAYFVKKTILAPNSITMCLLRAPEIIRGTMSPGNVSLDGSKQFMRTSNCHPWLMAIVDVKEDGLIRAGVMNTFDKSVTMQSGQQYGQVTLTCEVNEAHSLQARLAAGAIGQLHPGQFGHRPPDGVTVSRLTQE